MTSPNGHHHSNGHKDVITTVGITVLVTVVVVGLLLVLKAMSAPAYMSIATAVCLVVIDALLVAAAVGDHKHNRAHGHSSLSRPKKVARLHTKTRHKV